MFRRSILATILAASLVSHAAGADDPEVVSIKGHTGGATYTTFFSDGKTLLSWGADGALRSWDVGTGKEGAIQAAGRGPMNAVGFSRHGVAAVAYRRGDVVRWAADGKERALLKNEKAPPSALAFTPDGTRVAVGRSTGQLNVYEIDSGKELFECVGHADRVNDASLQFSPDGKILVSASDDCSLRVWDAETGKRKFTVTDLGNSVCYLWFSGDKLFFLDSYVYSSFQKCLNLGTGKVVSSCEAPSNGSGPSGLALALGGKVVLTAAHSNDATVMAGPTDGKPTRLRDTMPAEQFRVLPERDDTIVSVAGFRVVASRLVRAQNEIRVKQLRVVQEHTAKITGLSVSRDRKFAATADEKGVIKIWDVKKN